MGWIGCVHCEKLWCDFVARTSSLIGPVQPVLRRVSCSNETNPKCAQTIRNEPILEFRVQWGGSGAFDAKKFQCDLMAQTCPLIAPSSMLKRNIAKCIGTLRNAPEHEFGSNGVDRVCSLWKIPIRLYGTNLRINCTSSTRFAPSWQMHPNTRKNTPKHEFRVQWGGSCAFVAKNSDASSWHELLH